MNLFWTTSFIIVAGLWNCLNHIIHYCWWFMKLFEPHFSLWLMVYELVLNHIIHYCCWFLKLCEPHYSLLLLVYEIIWTTSFIVVDGLWTCFEPHHSLLLLVYEIVWTTFFIVGCASFFVTLSQHCTFQAYVKARILDENLLKSLETPEAPWGRLRGLPRRRFRDAQNLKFSLW